MRVTTMSHHLSLHFFNHDCAKLLPPMSSLHVRCLCCLVSWEPKTIHHGTSRGYPPTVKSLKTQREADAAVSWVLTERSQPSLQQRGQRKLKAYTAFTDEQRAAIHSNTAAVNRGQLPTENQVKNFQALKSHKLKKVPINAKIANLIPT